MGGEFGAILIVPWFNRQSRMSLLDNQNPTYKRPGSATLFIRSASGSNRLDLLSNNFSNRKCANENMCFIKV